MGISRMPPKRRKSWKLTVRMTLKRGNPPMRMVRPVDESVESDGQSERRPASARATARVMVARPRRVWRGILCSLVRECPAVDWRPY